MELYLNKAAVIIDLHERGFSEDFEIVGNGILWVQRKLLFKPKDFSLIEAHSVIGSDGSEQFILGASLLSHFADGIFVWHLAHVCDWGREVIKNKIKELLVRVPGFNSDVYSTEFMWPKYIPANS